MDARARPRCYPRGSFYPLSSNHAPRWFGGSLRPAFAPARPVSLTVKLACAFTRPGRFLFDLSQPLCPCVTFEQGTAPVKLPTRHCPQTRIQSLWVRTKRKKERCFIDPRTCNCTWSLLRSTVFSLNSKPSYSKAPRGLFVLQQLGRIFTAISISPGESSRQLLAR